MIVNLEEMEYLTVATYTIDGLEITAGNFYEQFGSGLIFRSYEEKGLGIDNAMDELDSNTK